MSEVVGQLPFLQHLQQDVEYVGVRFLYLIKEDDTERPARDLFRQETSLFVADIARGRSHEARHIVLFHEVRHVDAHQGIRVTKKESASVFATRVFPTPVGPRKTKDPSGRRAEESPVRERRIAEAMTE